MNTQRAFLLIISIVILLPFSSNAQKLLSRYRAAYHSSAIDYNHTGHLVTDDFIETFWKSKPGNVEWIYVDLGVESDIRNLRINWGEQFASAYTIQVSSQGRREHPEGWKEVYATQNGKGGLEEISLRARGRYVKLQSKNSSDGMTIKTLEIFGRGGLPAYANPPLLPIASNGYQYLHGGNWKVQRSSFVNAVGSQISQKGFNDSNWIPATVPGTILTSYYNIGAVADHNYGDMQLQISEEFFTADFWYRNTFTVPSQYNGKRVWLNFDGINYKAEIYVNGNKAGDIVGAYIRGKFDITQYVTPGQECAIAVLIRKNDHPGNVKEHFLKNPQYNGGINGLDGPTILASIGWNWMPTIRGRNTGIWSNVFLSSSADVKIENPFVVTNLNLPDTTQADFEIEATLTNHSDKALDGNLKSRTRYFSISTPVNIGPGETKTVRINKSNSPELSVANPELWWPNGYGAPNLDVLKLEFEADGVVSDTKETTYGVKHYTYHYNNSHLQIAINGVPMVVRGGNWGMPEAMLRCDSACYDLLVRLHKEMNMNMIRNWIGMTGHEEFYEACDRHGIMIWDDFWLANPVDGPHPLDNKLFMENAVDKVLRRRNNPSVAIWVGRNEGWPPATLDSMLTAMFTVYDNSRHYIPNSADRPASGFGPYETMHPKWYFQNRGNSFHSEQGLVCVPPLESMQEMMPEEYLWPINNMWGKHKWTQPRVDIYHNDMINRYGEPQGIEDFTVKAQMLNMEGPKSMMESWQSNRGGGVLLWMSHPAWPSLICQTYDYYFEPTAAYFAMRRGNNPVHILWRADNEKVQVVNNTLKDLSNLKINVELYDLHGKKVMVADTILNVRSNNLADAFTLSYPEDISKVHFIKLLLTDAAGNELGRNFYWRSSEYLNYTDLNNLPEVSLKGDAVLKSIGDKTFISISLSNPTNDMAVMTRLKLQQQKTGKRILPAFYSDNYISLVPGETQTVEAEFNTSILEGDNPRLLIEGWNIKPIEINIKKSTR
jgi:hypothetical protein